MKKVLFLLLILALLLPANCFAAAEESYDYIIALLKDGQYDMAIHVIEGLKMYSGDANGNSGSASNKKIINAETQTNGADWMFFMDLVNEGSQPMTLESLQIIDRADDSEFGNHFFAGPDLERIGLADFVLQPNEGRGWNDGHPVVGEFNLRDYIFAFRMEDGSEMRLVFKFNMQDAVMVEPPAGDWQFPCALENTTDAPIALVAMDISNLMDGQTLGTVIFEGEESLSNIGLGGLVLEPGQIFTWCDGHPVTDQFNGREYRFHFRHENGEVSVQSFRFDNLAEQNEAPDYSNDPGQNLRTLRHDAAFKAEVYPGVFWVPAASLGASSFSNMDIHNMLGASPEEKQAAISTLYEALQLYQVGNFFPADDNVRSGENGLNWEHHKPGYHAVRTNCGCCATDSNWLNYILAGDYDEIGFIATSQRDGSGHVYNYILQDGWYYFIDLTHYHAQGGAFDTAEENGDLNSYHSTDYILGNIHKAESVQAYVDYVQQTFGDPPGLMFRYTAENVLAVDSVFTQNGIRIVYEEANGLPIEVIFDDAGDQLEFGREESPKNLPQWDRYPDGNFGF